MVEALLMTLTFGFSFHFGWVLGGALRRIRLWDAALYMVTFHVCLFIIRTAVEQALGLP